MVWVGPWVGGVTYAPGSVCSFTGVGAGNARLNFLYIAVNGGFSMVSPPQDGGSIWTPIGPSLTEVNTIAGVKGLVSVTSSDGSLTVASSSNPTTGDGSLDLTLAQGKGVASLNFTGNTGFPAYGGLTLASPTGSVVYTGVGGKNSSVNLDVNLGLQTVLGNWITAPQLAPTVPLNLIPNIPVEGLEKYVNPGDWADNTGNPKAVNKLVFPVNSVACITGWLKINLTTTGSGQRFQLGVTLFGDDASQGSDFPLTWLPTVWLYTSPAGGVSETFYVPVNITAPCPDVGSPQNTLGFYSVLDNVTDDGSLTVWNAQWYGSLMGYVIAHNAI